MAKKKSFITNTFLAGILVLLPLAVTIYVLRFMYRLITSNLSPLISKFFSSTKIIIPEAFIGFLTVVIFVVCIFIIGLLIKLYIGRVLFRIVEKVMISIPLVRSVYNVIKQVVDSFGPTANTFEKVVLIKFPSPDHYCMGYVVRNTQPLLTQHTGCENAYNVFVPTAPNPTSGFIAIAKVEDCIELPISIDEGMKFILSVGIINFESEEQAKTFFSGL